MKNDKKQIATEVQSKTEENKHKQHSQRPFKKRIKRYYVLILATAFFIINLLSVLHTAVQITRIKWIIDNALAITAGNIWDIKGETYGAGAILKNIEAAAGEIKSRIEVLPTPTLETIIIILPTKKQKSKN